MLIPNDLYFHFALLRMALFSTSSSYFSSYWQQRCFFSSRVRYFDIFVSLFSFRRVFFYYTSLSKTESMCWRLGMYYASEKYMSVCTCILYNDGVRALVSCMYLPLDTKLLQTSLVAWKLTERNRKSGRRKQVCSSNHLLYHCDYVWVYVFNIYVYNFSVSAFACSRQSFSIWPIWNTYTDIQIL